MIADLTKHANLLNKVMQTTRRQVAGPTVAATSPRSTPNLLFRHAAGLTPDQPVRNTSLWNKTKTVADTLVNPRIPFLDRPGQGALANSGGAMLKTPTGKVPNPLIEQHGFGPAPWRAFDRTRQGIATGLRGAHKGTALGLMGMGGVNAYGRLQQISQEEARNALGQPVPQSPPQDILDSSGALKGFRRALRSYTPAGLASQVFTPANAVAAGNAMGANIQHPDRQPMDWHQASLQAARDAARPVTRTGIDAGRRFGRMLTGAPEPYHRPRMGPLVGEGSDPAYTKSLRDQYTGNVLGNTFRRYWGEIGGLLP